MGSIKQKNRDRRQRRRARYHKRSILAISGVLGMLIVMLAFGSVSLQAKNRNYKAHEAELKAQLEAEKARAEEIKDLEKYVGTDAYIEDLAKEKLRLIHPNEILFQAE